MIDDLIGLPYPYNAGESYDDVKKQLIGKLTGLKPGITQLTTHPSYVSEELIAVTPHYRKREMEYALLIDPDIKRLLETEGIRLASWKMVRDGFYKN
ncbi:hypothetical protein [Paenibacillus contaminans]|uniref:hypothetical protein n=1 Tax=Paenibacillus contaminans TaxID=450362 RepID=UPI0011BFCE65|nr:hypothetical protein [Paenibacillus contaminans]